MTPSLSTPSQIDQQFNLISQLLKRQWSFDTPGSTLKSQWKYSPTLEIDVARELAGEAIFPTAVGHCGNLYALEEVNYSKKVNKYIRYTNY